MRPDELSDLLKRRPFQPFRIHLSTNKTIDIGHPDQCAVGRSTFTVTVQQKDAGGFAGKEVVCSLLHIVAIEPVS